MRVVGWRLDLDPVLVVRSEMRQSFQIPYDLREFMREVSDQLDSGADRSSLVGPDALQTECARGGRIEDSDQYEFTYFAADGHGRWQIVVGEQQIHDIAHGQLFEIEADQLDTNTRTSRGEALIVWGEYDEDALRVRSLFDLGIVLDALHSMAQLEPCTLRMWSVTDDQALVVINGDECAIFVVASGDGYGTSIGDPTRSDQFDIVDHDAGAMTVFGRDCIPWRVGRLALIQFAEDGKLGGEVILEGSISSQLLMFGDFDRQAELESRHAPTADPAMSSVAMKSPNAAWAKRLLDSLLDLQLIEIDTSIRDAVTARLSILLTQLGTEAQDSPEAAHSLQRSLAKLRGVGALFATAGDLQISLRRTQDAPTMPVDVPLS
ncbi:MAG: hypothetical protein JWO36_1344 [Myxococcales bacterium]|nr:hypothetical protein [Myxococcales bacterium]